MTPRANVMALSAPTGAVVLLTQQLLEDTLQASRASPRRRMILPIHKSAADPLHRMFNALQPGTYIRPHWASPRKMDTELTEGRVVPAFVLDWGNVPQR
jgi:cupin fold WbuC family metalloprotein